jgi:hypothetical protein
VLACPAYDYGVGCHVMWLPSLLLANLVASSARRRRTVSLADVFCQPLSLAKRCPRTQRGHSRTRRNNNSYG